MECADLEIFSTRFSVLLADYYCRHNGLSPPSAPVRSSAEEARVRHKAISKAREGTGSEGDRRSPDVESSASGTTSTPSGARRSILRWHPSPEGRAAGERQGGSRVELARAGRLNRSTPQGVRDLAVRPAAGRVRMIRSARSGGCGGRKTVRLPRTGGLMREFLVFPGSRGHGRKARLPVAARACGRFPGGRRRLQRKPRRVRPGGESPRGVRLVSRPGT